MPKLYRKWLPVKRLARSLRNIEQWIYNDLICPICVETKHKWYAFDNVAQIVNHCVTKHFTAAEQFLLHTFLTYTEQRVQNDDQVQEAIDDVLEEHGKRDIKTSQCFCPFCLVIHDRYNPYASVRMFRTHFKTKHLMQ